jgi:esterase/lipase superfamily enzyme
LHLGTIEPAAQSFVQFSLLPWIKALVAREKSRWPWRFGLLLGLLAVAACAERPLEGVLTPVGDTAAGGSRVRILVASTRQRSTDAAQMYGGGRAGETSYAAITVSIPPDSNRKAGEVQWPRTLPGDPKRDFVTVSTDYLTKQQFLAAVDDNAKRTQGKVIVFIHGFNNRFDDAVYRFAQIHHDAQVPAVPVLFSWPSRGSAALRAYIYDKESANYSRDAFDELLDDLGRDRNVKETNVLAHSMGNWIAVETLRARALRGKRQGDKLKNVMLVAPDVDVDVFQAQLRRMGPNIPRLSLFVSRDDKALGLSEVIAGGVPRLGDIDPEQEPYKTEFEKAKIDVYDMTSMRSAHAHSKVFENVSTVVGMVRARFAAGQKMTDREGDGLGGVTGINVPALTSGPEPGSPRRE